MADEQQAPDAGDLVDAVQAAVQAMLDAVRDALDAVERLVHDPEATAKATELAQGVLTALAGLAVQQERNDDPDDGDELERIEVE